MERFPEGAGIEPGTSRTNQFEGKRATDWATMPVEILLGQIQTKYYKYYVYILRDGLQGSFLRKQALSMYNNLQKCLFLYVVILKTLVMI